MPIEQVPGSELTYHLICFDANGRERTESDGNLLSRRTLEQLTRDPFTDVFLFSHGWQGDVPAAREQYNLWTSAMAGCPADLQRMRHRSQGFRPLLIGLHWPSLPWGNEEMGGGTAASFAVSAGPTTAELVDSYARRIADTPTARAALTTIFAAAEQDVAPDTLSPEVRVAYQTLDHEAALGAGGEGADPGGDREPFNAEDRYQESRGSAASFGVMDFLGGLLSPLRQLSFWKMKDRARTFGESGGHTLLKSLQAARPEARFHLMGHSFGCIAVSATVAGPAGSSLVRPVDSLTLVQGALSLWSYCPDIPVRPGRPGYFNRIVTEQRVAGPLLTTQSTFDTAVGRWYPLGAGAARQVSFAPSGPVYGAVGAFGLRGLDAGVEDLELKPADAAYAFRPGGIYNLECSGIIRTGDGASGAHSDIAHPEVAHAVWTAALGAG